LTSRPSVIKCGCLDPTVSDLAPPKNITPLMKCSMSPINVTSREGFIIKNMIDDLRDRLQDDPRFFFFFREICPIPRLALGRHASFYASQCCPRQPSVGRKQINCCAPITIRAGCSRRSRAGHVDVEYITSMGSAMSYAHSAPVNLLPFFFFFFFSHDLEGELNRYVRWIEGALAT